MPVSTTPSSGFTSGAATSLTISHTSDGNPLYVLLSWFILNGGIEAADIVTGVTFNGFPLTRGGQEAVAGNTMEWWRLAAPSVGTHNVVITLSSGRRVSAGVLNLTDWPGAASDHRFTASASNSSTPPTVTVDSVAWGEVLSWIGFNDSTQNVTEPSGSSLLWNLEGMGGGSPGDQVSAGSIQDGAAVSTTLSWAGTVMEYFGVAAISSAPSAGNLLTGQGHTVKGNHNLVAGTGGTVSGNRNVLLALCDDSPAPSIEDDDTFKVCAAAVEITADTVDLNGTVNVNGSPLSNGITRQITFVFDGGSSALTTGAKKIYIYVPYACTITAVTLLADQSGSVVLEIKKVVFGSFPGSLASIVASAPPTLSSAQKSQDTTLTGWTTSIAAGDCLEVSVSSAATLTSVFGSLTVSV